MGVSKTSDGRYYVYYQFRSKQRKEYFGKSPQDKAAAEQKDLFLKLLKKQGKKVFEDFINNELREKKSLTTSSSDDEPQEVYLDYLGQQYANHLKRKNASYNYLHKLQNLLNKYALPIYSKDAKPVNELTYLDVIPWFDSFTSHNGYSPLTRRAMLALAKSMFNFGINIKLTSNNPLQQEKTPANYKLNYQLTLEDLRSIISHAAPHVAWAIEVGYETAARFGPTELFKLEWRDVDFENNTIHIRGTKTSTSDRVIPITQNFKEKLLEVRNTGLVYANSKYRPPIYLKHPTKIVFYRDSEVLNNIHGGFKAACRRANITYNVRPYDIRHLSISQMLANGGNLKAISEIAGHSNITITAMYLHTLNNEKERSVNQREAL